MTCEHCGRRPARRRQLLDLVADLSRNLIVAATVALTIWGVHIAHWGGL